jgi:hypothetical protein
MSNPWQTIESAPAGVWIQTKLTGENGDNICMKIPHPYDEVEWVERETGVTTVTHSTFAAPSHWRPLYA